MPDRNMRVWVVVSGTKKPPWRYHLNRACANLAMAIPTEGWLLGELQDAVPGVSACLACIKHVAAERGS